jgi:hypothetical protein
VLRLLSPRYVLSSEGRSAFLGDYLLNPTKLDPLILSHSRNDLHVTRKKHLEGYDKIAALRPVIDGIARRYDALVTPSTVDEAPVRVEPERHTGEAIFNLMWTILHVPVLNVSPHRRLALAVRGADGPQRIAVAGLCRTNWLPARPVACRAALRGRAVAPRWRRSRAGVQREGRLEVFIVDSQ